VDALPRSGPPAPGATEEGLIMDELTCVCRRRFGSRQGRKVHERTCKIERARSDAFVKAIEDGLRGDDVLRAAEAAAVAALAASTS
jgi:hypothetical protein